MRGSTNIAQKRFVECDGSVSGSFTKALGALGGIFGGAAASVGLKAGIQWKPRRIFYECASITSLVFYEEPRVITPAERRRVPHPNQVARFYGVDDMLQQLDNNVAPLPEDELYEDIPAVFAPAGWYFSVGILNNDEYHIANEKDAEAIANASNNDPVADAILRLADEIALKPATVSGSEVQAAMARQKEYNY